MRLESYKSFTVPSFEKYITNTELTKTSSRVSYGIGDYNSRSTENYTALGVFNVGKVGGMWVISGYAIWNEWAKKGLGVDFFIYNLRRLRRAGITELHSMHGTRGPKAERLWERLKERTDIKVEEITLSSGRKAYKASWSDLIKESSITTHKQIMDMFICEFEDHPYFELIDRDIYYEDTDETIHHNKIAVVDLGSNKYEVNTFIGIDSEEPLVSHGQFDKYTLELAKEFDRISRKYNFKYVIDYTCSYVDTEQLPPALVTTMVIEFKQLNESRKYLKKFESYYDNDIINSDIKVCLQSLVDDGFEYELINSANFPTGKHLLSLSINDTHISHNLQNEINKCLRKVKSIDDKRIVVSIVIDYKVVKADNEEEIVTGGCNYLFYNNILPDTFDAEVESKQQSVKQGVMNQDVVKNYEFPLDIKVSLTIEIKIT